MRYKIVEVDNFDRDYPPYPEEFVNLPLLDENQAREIADIINKNCCGPNSERYWRVVEETYTLKPPFEP